MSWQDIGLTLGGMLFTLALIPTLIGVMKPPLSTALMTGTLLYFFGAIYLSLGLVFATVSIVANGTAWFAIAAQAWRHRSSKKQKMSAVWYATAACDRPEGMK